MKRPVGRGAAQRHAGRALRAQRHAPPLPHRAARGSRSRPGDNRLRFVFARTASPVRRRPEEPRPAPARGGLLQRSSRGAASRRVARGPAGARRAAAVRRRAREGRAGADAGRPGAWSASRCGCRPAPSCASRPSSCPSARAAAGAASFRVLLEDEAAGEREIWSRVHGRRAASRAGEQVVRLPGRAGDIVRLGLAVGAAGRPRFAWGRLVAPRVLGVAGRRAARARSRSRQEIDARADPLRQSLAAARSTCCSSSSTPAARARSAPTATRARRRPRSTAWPRTASSSSASTRPPSTRSARCRRSGPRSTPTATTARCRSRRGCRRTG